MCKFRKTFTALCVLGLALLSSGCSLAPKYARPDAPIPNIYPAGPATGPQAELPAWKEFFKDPGMQRVIELALENNRDLRVAMLNIEKTREQYRIRRADLLPTINAAGSASNQGLPADISPTGARMVSRQYSASLGFSAFELDLFGRIRSLTEQALENYYSVEAEAEAARISLIAETAAMYLQLVADREIYDLTQATVTSRQKGYDLIKRKFDAGVSSELDLSQSESLLNESLTALSAAATRVGQDENYLALLMGAPLPQDLPKVRSLAQVTPLEDVPAGLPSTLLERRPDILAAEHLLKGANANIGAARANFFPTISLTGAFGKMSADYNNLWDGAAKAWTFLPQISLPIFDTGRNLAALGVSQTEKDIAVARYEKSIQTAFREVADALVQRENIDNQLDSQKSLVASTQRSYNLADVRYSAGISDYLNVLAAQRSLYAAQTTLISTVLLKEANALALYKALGGGWDKTDK